MRRKFEEQWRITDIYNYDAKSSEIAGFYALQKTDKEWLDVFRTLASFCRKHKTVLNVGCGPYELMAVKNDEDVVGIDISDVALEMLLDYGFKGQVVQADCRHLPFKSQSFDCLVSSFVIEHLTSMTALETTIKEMQRVSENIMIVTPNSAFFRRQNDPTHFFFFTTRDLNRMMPSFKIFASNLPPTQTLRHYLLYDSPKLRKLPLVGSLLFDAFRLIDSSNFFLWLNKKLWVGNHLIAVQTAKKG